MTFNFHSQHPPDGAVIQLENVSIDLLPSYDVGIENVSFELDRGGLALVKFDPGIVDHPLADIISGLAPVATGKIKVFGHTWPQWGPDAQAKARGRIGRVFAFSGWINNLDIDENITLAQRYHQRAVHDDLLAEANRLARMVHLEGIPEGRPSAVPRNQLRRAEWIRAALGNPWLALLEFPGRDLSEGWLDSIKPLVTHMRERGTAIIWICDFDKEWQDESLNPSLKLFAVGNKLQVEK